MSVPTLHLSGLVTGCGCIRNFWKQKDLPPDGRRSLAFLLLLGSWVGDPSAASYHITLRYSCALALNTRPFGLLLSRLFTQDAPSAETSITPERERRYHRRHNSGLLDRRFRRLCGPSAYRWHQRLIRHMPYSTQGSDLGIVEEERTYSFSSSTTSSSSRSS